MFKSQTRRKSKIVSTPKHSSYNDTNINSSVDIPIPNESPECTDEPSNAIPCFCNLRIRRARSYD